MSAYRKRSVTVTKMTGSEPDLYSRLGVSPDAPVEVIDAAYKALMKRNHPDLAAGEEDRQARELLCRELGEAHATLKDATSRERYDATLRRAARDRYTDDSAFGSSSNGEPGRFAQGTDIGQSSRGTASSYGSASDRSGTPAATPSGTTSRSGSTEAGSIIVDPQGRPLAEYDDLTWSTKRKLASLAGSDPAWRAIRRALLKRRVRVLGIPAVWLRLRGEPTGDRSKVTLEQLAIASLVGIATASVALLLWSSDVIADWSTSLHPFHWSPILPQLTILASVVTTLVSGLVSTAVWWVLYPKVSRWPRGVSSSIPALMFVYAVLLAAPYLVTVAAPIALFGLAVKIASRNR